MECTKKECVLWKTMHCPACAECGSGSSEIDDDCVNCWNCMHDEGYIRSKGKESEMIEIIQYGNN